MTANSAVKSQESYKELKEGDIAPDFKSVLDSGESVSLADIKGKKIVLYFYPKDDTTGCTVEAKDFSCMIPDFEKESVTVIGVSKDSVEKHVKFKNKYSLAFKLISDENSDVCEKYGVWVEKSMYGKKYMGIERATFVIDEQGKIAKIWNKVKVDGHAQQVLEFVKAM